MEQIIGLLFFARNVAHIEHLKTKSYAKHKALGHFYDDVIDLADKLAEAYQGDKGLLEDIPLYAKLPDYAIDVFLEKQLKTIDELRKDATDRSAIQNIIDEVVELYLSTLYKLRNLS
jgi:hypothetical protein